MVKHQINQDAGNGNVKPDWHRPFRDAAMFVPAALEYRHQSENDKREGDESEEDMTGQHWKINRCQPAVKARGLFSDVDVISDIANEKQGGGNDCRDHTDDVALPIVAPDEIPAGGDQNSADQIERGINRREIGDGKHAKRFNR